MGHARRTALWRALLLGAGIRTSAIRVSVKPVIGKGLGVLAMEPIEVTDVPLCCYQGEVICETEMRERYPPDVPPVYLFELRAPDDSKEGLYIDGNSSDHWSKFINHAEHGNLEGRLGEDCIEFVAVRPIAVGEELTFDYGIDYWAGRPGQPADDSRKLLIAVKRAAAQLRPLLPIAREVYWTLAIPVVLPFLASSHTSS